MSETIVRPCTPEDVEALAPVLVEVHARDGYPVEGVADPVAWLRPADPIGAWVADLDGTPVGHVALVHAHPDDPAVALWRDATGGQATDAAVLVRLFVAPTARGHGLGAHLTTTAADAARATGRTAILQVMTKDHDAVRLYERLGWTRIGHLVHHHPGGSGDAWIYTAPTPA